MTAEFEPSPSFLIPMRPETCVGASTDGKVDASVATASQSLARGRECTDLLSPARRDHQAAGPRTARAPLSVSRA